MSRKSNQSKSQDFSGYIYIASNPAMPELVKIGMTSKSPKQRVAELFNTSVPVPFVLEYSCKVHNRYTVEDYLHTAFNAKRVKSLNPATNRKVNREFFKLDVPTAIHLTEKGIQQRYRRYHRRQRLKLVKWAIFISFLIVVIGIYLTGAADAIVNTLSTIISRHFPFQ